MKIYYYSCSLDIYLSCKRANAFLSHWFAFNDGVTSYVFKWVRGRRSGEGTMCYITDLEHGDASLGFRGGIDGMYRTHIYRGKWSADKPHGKGELITEDGVKQCGTMKDGLLAGIGHYEFPRLVLLMRSIHRETKQLLPVLPFHRLRENGFDIIAVSQIT